jgi:long-chain acyl-CoA synthetase
MEEAAYQLKDSGAQTLITSVQNISHIQPVLSEVQLERIIVTDPDLDLRLGEGVSSESSEVSRKRDVIDMVSLLRVNKPNPAEIPLDAKKDLAHLSYTGGTTGRPKGVMLTHYNVVANTLQVASWMLGAGVGVENEVFVPVFPDGVDPDHDRLIHLDRETTLVVSPWFHALGTIRYLNNQVYQGSTIVLFSRFDSKEYLEAIIKYRVTTLGGAPQLYIPLVNHPDFQNYDLSGVKYAASGAAPLPKPLLEKMQNAFSGLVCEAYGLTECTMGAATNPLDPDKIRPGSIGLPYFDTEMKVVDTKTGKDLNTGAEGEICIRGPQVMKGYFNRPEETASVLKGSWLYTGDIGREDEDGFFYITSRKKDMIIYKGYNVYPLEIEEVIFQHSAVQQCAVVGKPDPEAGEIPVAFVEMKKGESVTPEEIMEHTNSKIARYKKIRDVIFLEKLPISGPGKVLKKELRERFR